MAGSQSTSTLSRRRVLQVLVGSGLAAAITKWPTPVRALLRQITINRIAQRYLTDRVVGILRTRGWRNVLVSLGEGHALGPRPDGEPWRLALASGPLAKRMTTPLSNAALAISRLSATVFESTGRHHHILSPRSGRSSSAVSLAIVHAPSATLADGLSTALCAGPLSEAERTLASFNDVTASLTDPTGRTHDFIA